MKRKSINEVVEKPKEDESYVLVTRYYPRKLRSEGLSMDDEENPIDMWDKELAPSKELLKDWKEDKISWEDYEERYLSERPKVLINRKARIYRDYAMGREVVLVCLEDEEDYPYCHTWIILDVLEEAEDL